MKFIYVITWRYGLHNTHDIVLIVQWYLTHTGLRLNIKKKPNFVQKFAKSFIFIQAEDTRMRLGAEIRFHLDFCVTYYD